MNVKSKENVENSAVELIIEVGAQEFEAALDKVYKKQRGSIAVPGFRKGKAPRKIIEGMYGSGAGEAGCGGLPQSGSPGGEQGRLYL